jgi:DNA-binding GntR family transcriptional regulator
MEVERNFEQVRPQSMRYDVLRQLRKAILDGRFRPGERLNESHIAREMGISRGPVREAMQALEQEGLIQTVHWKGSFVAELDPQAFRELVELRILLETHAARAATVRCTPAEIAELDDLIAQMRLACRAGDIDEMVNYDLAFHHAICRLAGNRMMVRVWEQLAGRMRLAVLLSIEEGYDPASMIETHPPVLEAMRLGDGDLAAQHLNERTWQAAERIYSALSDRLARQPAE